MTSSTQVLPTSCRIGRDFDRLRRAIELARALTTAEASLLQAISLGCSTQALSKSEQAAVRRLGLHGYISFADGLKVTDAGLDALDFRRLPPVTTGDPLSDS